MSLLRAGQPEDLVEVVEQTARTFGSNCVARPPSRSETASGTENAGRYTRSLRRMSKTSATAVMRPSGVAQVFRDLVQRGHLSLHPVKNLTNGTG
jgi:hypothetical protein